MKQKALRAGDAHSHEDEECRKRLRSARECAKAHSFFCVYDEPSADLCLHKDLHLANVHHRAVKRDGVQSIPIE